MTKKEPTREEIGLREALGRIRKGCEPGHTNREFSWGLLASQCEIDKSEAFGLVIRLHPWAQSYTVGEEKKVLDHRGPHEYDMAAKRCMIQAIEHLLRVYEGRLKELSKPVLAGVTG